MRGMSGADVLGCHAERSDEESEAILGAESKHPYPIPASSYGCMLVSGTYSLLLFCARHFQLASAEFNLLRHRPRLRKER